MRFMDFDKGLLDPTPLGFRKAVTAAVTVGRRPTCQSPLTQGAGRRATSGSPGFQPRVLGQRPRVQGEGRPPVARGFNPGSWGYGPLGSKWDDLFFPRP
jgi:hypothetical protein